MPTLNIGILAHIDAGKTSLTERLLYDTGAIDRLGAVDARDTQTDTDEIERRRGITIRAAVAPFGIDGLQVNVVDTPGHPDFIAEVERALAVLDGAVLVVSAVEGVQPQTRVLHRVLRERGLPTLIFVNKVDRPGARPDAVLQELRSRLGARLAPMTRTGDEQRGGSTRTDGPPLTDERHRLAVAEVLADRDEMVLAELVQGASPTIESVSSALVDQVRHGQLCPVYAGSALTGEGIAELLGGIGGLLPPAPTDEPGLSGTVFAVELNPASGGAGQKVAYVRMHAGEIAVRQRITFRRREPDGGIGEDTGRITSLRVARAGTPGAGQNSWANSQRLTAGNIARVSGLAAVRVGDRIGPVSELADSPAFPPPRLETVVRPRLPEQRGRLHAALLSLADQDPLIRTRVLPDGGSSVLLHGEVQQEVIAARLLDEFGVCVHLEPTRPVYLERVTGVAEAREEMGGWHRQVATVGLRVEPAQPSTGLDYRLEVELGSLPAGFHRAVRESVVRALEQGLFGWAVPDCVVVLTRSGYSSADSTAGDFRRLTPIVLLRALRQAGTRVHEPLDEFEATLPTEHLSVVTSRLAGLGAEVRMTDFDPTSEDAALVLRGSIPTRHVDQVGRWLPDLTRGEGAWWSRPGGDRPVPGEAPRRERTDGNPLDPVGYLRLLARGQP